MENFVNGIPEPLRSLMFYGAIFIIVFAVVYNVLQSASMFDRKTTLIISVCMSLLGVYGLDVVFIRSLLLLYGSLGALILALLAVLVLGLWILKILRHRY